MGARTESTLRHDDRPRNSARAVQAEPIENIVARARDASDAAARRRAVKRGAQLERDAARALGGTRTALVGSRGRRPDVSAIPLPCGVVLIPEAKARKRLPRVLVDALEQARRYAPGCEPLAVLRELGGRTIVAIDLSAFARIAGIESAALSGLKATPTPRDPRQGQLFEELRR